MASPPVVLFIVPDKYTMAYTAMILKLSGEALASINKEPNDVELVGFISPSSEYVGSCLNLLGSSSVNPYNVIALVLLGEVGDQLGFNSANSDDYMLGSVIIPGSLVSYTTMCIPSIETGWLKDPANWERFRVAYAGLLKNGRKELQGSENYLFITRDKVNWN